MSEIPDAQLCNLVFIREKYLVPYLNYISENRKVFALSYRKRQTMQSYMYVALAMATYTFYCVVLAILNLVRLKKDKTVQKIILRNCSMVYAIGSLFGLERMMLGTFGKAEDYFTLVMEAISGAGFFIIIIMFGINLLMLSSKMEISFHAKTN